MFRAIIVHHQELGTVCAAIRYVSCEVPSSVVYIAAMVLWVVVESLCVVACGSEVQVERCNSYGCVVEFCRCV
jgi:hypothetical protein